MKNKFLSFLFSLAVICSRADTFIPIADAPSFNRDLRFQSSISGTDYNRVILRTNSDTESGGNAGSNFVINTRADDGSNLGNAVRILRASFRVDLYGADQATDAGDGALVLPNGGLYVARKIIAGEGGYFGGSLTVRGAASGSLGAQIRIANTAAKATGNTSQLFFDTFVGTSNSWSFQAYQESATDGDQTLRVALGGVAQVLWFTPIGIEIKTTTDADISTGEASIQTDGGVLANKAIASLTYFEGIEQASSPAAPPANGFRIYAKDNGSGKTVLYVKFSSGAEQQLAIQP